MFWTLKKGGEPVQAPNGLRTVTIEILSNSNVKTINVLVPDTWGSIAIKEWYASNNPNFGIDVQINEQQLDLWPESIIETTELHHDKP